MLMLIRRGFLLLIVIAMSWMANMLFGWLPTASSAQREALSQLRAPMERATGERNAFMLFWFLPYDVDEADHYPLLAADSDAIRAWGSSGAVAALPSLSLPRLLVDEPAPLEFCGRDGRCLSDLRSNPEAVRDVLRTRQAVLDKLDRLGDFDHYRTSVPITLATPIPYLQDAGRLQAARSALRHLDGDSDAALRGICRDLRSWRRLKGRSDSLVFEMVNLAWQRQLVEVFADIRAELPREHPLPPDCAEAMAAPVPEQRQSCDVYRAEFAAVEHTFTHLYSSAVPGERSWRERARDMLIAGLVNREASLATMAPGYWQSCVALGLPMVAWPERLDTGLRCRTDERFFNPVGCVLAELAVPNTLTYLRRERDSEGLLRLLALGEWLAHQPEAVEALASRPDVHRGFEQDVSLEGDVLLLHLAEPRNPAAPTWRLPLPGSRVIPRP